MRRLILFLAILACACTEVIEPPSKRFALETFQIVGGREVRVIERGSGAKETLVFLHEYGSSADSFKALIDGLSEDARLIAIDLRGWGLTERFDSDTYDFEGQVQWLRRVLDRLEVSGATFVGNGVGALLAIAMSVEDGTRVQRLVLMDAARMDGEEPGIFAAARLPGASCFSICMTVGNVRDTLHNLYSNDSLVTDARVDQYHRGLKEPNGRSAAVAAIRGVDYERIEALYGEKLTAITVPSLLVRGEADPWSPLRYARALQEKLPNSELLIMPDVGHMPHEEKPLTMAKQLREFMKRTPVAPAPPFVAATVEVNERPLAPEEAVEEVAPTFVERKVNLPGLHSIQPELTGKTLPPGM